MSKTKKYCDKVNDISNRPSNKYSVGYRSFLNSLVAHNWTLIPFIQFDIAKTKIGMLNSKAQITKL